jgi:hypothetical protein
MGRVNHDQPLRLALVVQDIHFSRRGVTYQIALHRQTSPSGH